MKPTEKSLAVWHTTGFFPPTSPCSSTAGGGTTISCVLIPAPQFVPNLNCWHRSRWRFRGRTSGETDLILSELRRPGTEISQFSVIDRVASICVCRVSGAQMKLRRQRSINVLHSNNHHRDGGNSVSVAGQAKCLQSSTGHF